jgi:hypothetical protein
MLRKRVRTMQMPTTQPPARLSRQLTSPATPMRTTTRFRNTIQPRALIHQATVVTLQRIHLQPIPALPPADITRRPAMVHRAADQIPTVRRQAAGPIMVLSQVLIRTAMEPDHDTMRRPQIVMDQELELPLRQRPTMVHQPGLATHLRTTTELRQDRATPQHLPMVDTAAAMRPLPTVRQTMQRHRVPRAIATQAMTRLVQLPARQQQRLTYAAARRPSVHRTTIVL